MNQTAHRLGVSETNLVKRNLKLKPCNQHHIDDAVQEIDQLFGLDNVSFNEASWKLSVAYDASRICLDRIEEALTNNDVEVDGGWWTRLKESHYKFVDQNVKDNSNREPWSCH